MATRHYRASWVSPWLKTPWKRILTLRADSVQAARQCITSLFPSAKGLKIVWIRDHDNG